MMSMYADGAAPDITDDAEAEWTDLTEPDSSADATSTMRASRQSRVVPLTVKIQDRPWEAFAGCLPPRLNLPSNERAMMFFPHSEKPEAAEPAKAVCRPCPVKDLCLLWAMANGEPGIYGEHTAKERSRLRRMLRAEHGITDLDELYWNVLRKWRDEHPDE